MKISLVLYFSILLVVVVVGAKNKIVIKIWLIITFYQYSLVVVDEVVEVVEGAE
jgi:hypothetical protein